MASASRRFGERWFNSKRSLVLIAPSVAARLNNNIMIHPAHSELRLVEGSLHHPVVLDGGVRLGVLRDSLATTPGGRDKNRPPVSTLTTTI
jgi:hypothetical protein